MTVDVMAADISDNCNMTVADRTQYNIVAAVVLVIVVVVVVDVPVVVVVVINFDGVVVVNGVVLIFYSRTIVE